MRTFHPLPIVPALAGLLDGLFEAVAARHGKFPFHGPFLVFIWRVFERVKQRFATLAARVAAGKTLSRRRRARPEGAGAPRPRFGAGTEPAPRPRPARDRDLFRLDKWVTADFGWLCRVMKSAPEECEFARALTRLLVDDPDMRALLAATPRMGRILRPLCFMLGVNLALLHPTGVAPASSADDAAPVVSAEVSTGAGLDRFAVVSSPATAGTVPGRDIVATLKFLSTG